ncbi:MAG: hypothetical protein QW561_04545 [Candidatus Aenigmatarchaeota archaeon]
MEWSLRILIAAVLGLIVVLIILAVIMGWGGGAQDLVKSFLDFIQGIFVGKPTTLPG